MLWTETQYDALSRPIKIIPPDGSASANNTQFAYLGNKTTVTDPAGKQRATLTDAFGRVVQVHEPGYEDGRPGTGSVTIEGFLQSDSYEECTLWWEGECFSWEWITVYDSGGIEVAVGSTIKYVSYGQGSTASSLAAALAGAFNNDPNSPVTAAASGGVISFVAEVGGPATNYSLSATSWTDDPIRFSGPSFWGTPSGSTLTGGSATPSPDTPLVTTSTYDVLDNLVLVGQGAQQRTFTYDSLGRLKTATTPEAGTVSYSYNSFSLLATMVDARGVDTTYTYDNLNRLKTVSYNVSGTTAAATSALQYFYDEVGGGAYAQGRLTRVTQGGVDDEKYVYDALGRVTQLTKKISGTNYVIGYAYNRAGAITQITYPSNRQVAHSFDAIGRLTQVASGCTNYVSGVTYNAAHAPTAYNFGNGVAAAIGYNSRFQLASLAYTKSTTKLLELAYSYTGHANGGNNGQITGITDSTGTQEEGRSVSYTYDAWARLKTAATTGSTNYPAWGLSWTYDRFGNRKQQTVTAGTAPSNTVTVSAANNRITDSGYNYDAAGNMTADGVNTLTYDGESRVVTSATGGVTTTSSYDSAGLRVKKQVGAGTATIYIFSGSKVIAEYAAGAGAGSPTREYIYGGSALVATLEGSTTKYHHTDHLSIRVHSNSAGSKTGEQGHYPFGESFSTSSGSNSKFRFTSYERDEGSGASGNDYAVFRTYINRLGRFNRPDPIAGSILDPQSLNRYAYVRNNPVNLVDPLGLESCLLWIQWMDNDTERTYWEGYFCSGDSDVFVAEQESRERAGGGVGAIKKALDLVKSVLSGDNDCADFFNASGLLGEFSFPEAGLRTAAEAVDSIPIATGDSPQPFAIQLRANPRTIRFPQTAGATGAGAQGSITVYNQGAFFNESTELRTRNNIPLGSIRFPNIGDFRAGGLGAQATILLHEIAHVLGVIPDDEGAGGSRRNTATILEHCAAEIKKAIGSGGT